jgi:hypothetical protein
MFSHSEAGTKDSSTSCPGWGKGRQAFWSSFFLVLRLSRHLIKKVGLWFLPRWRVQRSSDQCKRATKTRRISAIRRLSSDLGEYYAPEFGVYSRRRRVLWRGNATRALVSVISLLRARIGCAHSRGRGLLYSQHGRRYDHGSNRSRAVNNSRARMACAVWSGHERARPRHAVGVHCRHKVRTDPSIAMFPRCIRRLDL